MKHQTSATNINDFVSELKLPEVKTLRGLNGNSPAEGVGTVEWKIRDALGQAHATRTQACYVPSAQIRLFSPQAYFTEVEK